MARLVYGENLRLKKHETKNNIKIKHTINISKTNGRLTSTAPQFKTEKISQYYEVNPNLNNF